MPFGILEDYAMEHVPGTTHMTRSNERSDQRASQSGVPVMALKHGTGKESHIILSPQPSDDPNDPLNWPLWQKDLILLITGLAAAVVGAYGPMLSPGFVQISQEMGISVNTLAQSTSWLILAIAGSLFLANPVAKKFGKRPVYVVSIIIMFVSSVWGAESKNYRSFLGSRIVGGFGMAPYEVLVQCTIGDMYFVHQASRGSRIAGWNLFLLCGIAGGALVSGYIIQNLGYRWTFWICGIFFGVLVIGVIFFVPETAYHRQPPTVRRHDIPLRDLKKEDETYEHKEFGVITTDSERPQSPDPISVKRMSWIRSLRIFTGTHSRAPFWKIAVRPFVIFWYPAVIWAFLVYGTTLTWIVVFSVVNASIFTLPPYNFSVSEVGLVSLSPFILTIIGEVISGPLNDRICVLLTKRNKGVYEPEFRLVLMFPVMLIGIAGFYGFGASVHYKTHWLGPVLTFGLANMSLAFANVCVFGYVIDSYVSLTEEAFVAISARNFLTFGLTYFVNDWLASAGALSVFNVLGSLFVATCLLTIPMWIFGKKCRSKVARIDWLNSFMSDKE